MKRISRACLAMLALTATAAGGAQAASITHQKFGGTGPLANVEFIAIEGDLKQGDEEQFRRLSIQYDHAVVVLDSRGGALIPAMEIGKLIHIKEYVTLVPDQTQCTSACALIWVAGSTRFLSPGGHVGFHASYLDNNGKAEETGLGNALVGHYLTLLNLPEKAIIFATAAGPHDILWLNKDNMSDAGIDFEDFDDSGKAAEPPPPVIQTVTTPVATQTTKPSGWIEVAATNRVKEYIDFDRITDVGSYKAAWIKSDHSADPDATYFESKDLWYFDCRSRRIGLKAYVNYDRRGNNIGSQELPDYEMEWQSVVPDSVGEAKLDAVCG